LADYPSLLTTVFAFLLVLGRWCWCMSLAIIWSPAGSA